jgi:hypothetical protein
MIELVSGMPAPHFKEESSWVRESGLVQGSCCSCSWFWLMWFVFACPLRCFRLLSVLQVPQVEGHLSSAYALIMWKSIWLRDADFVLDTKSPPSGLWNLELLFSAFSSFLPFLIARGCDWTKCTTRHNILDCLHQRYKWSQAVTWRSAWWMPRLEPKYY